MRKIALLATAVAALFGIVAVAYAANTYTVTVASVSPTKAGTKAKPKPTKVSFGYQVGETANNRPSVTTDYVIGFGKNIRNGRKYFKGKKVCTVSQAGYSAGSAPNCPAGAKAGTGTVQNFAGITSDPTSKIACQLNLTLYVGDGKAVPAAANDGIAVKNDIVLALKGGPPTCPLAVDAAIPSGFRTVSGGAALAFHVKKIPFQQPSPGIDNSVVNVTSKTGASARVKQRVRGRLKTVTRGLFETVGCSGGGHDVTVKFTDASGSTTTATKKAPCRK